ncbi:MAG TPA: mechanosensitive ion channel domain-containing protein [Candidatus Dormibacteraeota bacterium]|jgi:small conductance mechanosensitive channel|nr:mechanosensitive ion channel domain-containing protein [Candidatus Dormibacteraeota bacterium]
MTESFKSWTQIAQTRGLRVLAIIIIAIIVARLLRALTNRLVEAAKSSTRIAQMREQQTRTMAGILYSAGIFIIVAVSILTALPEFGFNVTPIEAAAAVASLAFGFGAQHLVKDLINGFFIVFEDQFVVGDLIQVNSELGRVEYLTLRRTMIRNTAGALVTISNGLIGQVSNFSRDWSQVFVDVTVPSEEHIGRALATLEKVTGDLRNDPDWSPALVDGPRVLGVESLSLDGNVLRTQVRTVLNRKEDVARELRRRIKLGFEQSRIPTSQLQRVTLQGELPQPPQQSSEMPSTRIG